MKMPFLFFVESILTFIIFYLWVFNSEYSGGNIGMAPFLMFITLIIQIIISVIIYFTMSNIIKGSHIFFIINIIIYAIVLYFFDTNGFQHIFKNDLSGFLTRSSLLSHTFVSIIMMILFSTVFLSWMEK